MFKQTYYKDKLCITSRANNAINNKYGTFYKSYIKHPLIHKVHAKSKNSEYLLIDFYFEYKNKKYIVKEIDIHKYKIYKIE